MFKLSRILKHQNLNLLNSTISNRTYYYQTEIYNNEKVESRRVNNQFFENLRKQNENLYEKAKQEPNLYRFIKAYHQYGFKIGEINPLKLETIKNLPQELDPLQYGLDRSQSYSTSGLLFNSNSEEPKSLNEIEDTLRAIYSKNITIEFDHISNEEEKLWIAREFESMSNKSLESKTRIEILNLLLKSQVNKFF
jgi:2-oxoglutarate dehydrogenase complex dehydrogenase (E1) component-like enzyme